MPSSRKLVELEALRGIAAITVLVHHFMLGFTPRLHGLSYPDQPWSLFGTPAFALVNGSAAVVVFFVLSGFVLSLRVLRTGSAEVAALAALKRWPRLAGPVILTNAMAGGAMAAGLFSNPAVAPLVPSKWLAWFYTWPSAGFAEIPQSIWEGATTFFTAHSLYNSSLWTMRYEFEGSFLVLIAALLWARLPRFQTPILSALWLAAFLASPYLSPFVVGVALATRHEAGPGRDWTWRGTAAAIVAILLLGGYHEAMVGSRPEGLYAPLAPLAALDPLRLRVVLHTLAAVLALFLFQRSAPIRRAMSGQVGSTLGFLSFGIYLCQIIVICSASSAVFEATVNWGRGMQIGATFLVTVAGTLALAVPVAIFDRWWMGQVGRLFTLGHARYRARAAASA
ncbi:acyltransferase family protein [Aureimonas sp. AU40]|uniref:acyltransferase family protein n=1 Tax=Aureimonas sp. AU40 TaxID=1637747 RepID=UPI000AECBFD4|nr:acyltransferase [Aureimonas sp. AU40]